MFHGNRALQGKPSNEDKLPARDSASLAGFAFLLEFGCLQEGVMKRDARIRRLHYAMRETHALAVSFTRLRQVPQVKRASRLSKGRDQGSFFFRGGNSCDRVVDLPGISGTDFNFQLNGMACPLLVILETLTSIVHLPAVPMQARSGKATRTRRLQSLAGPGGRRPIRGRRKEFHPCGEQVEARSREASVKGRRMSTCADRSAER